MFNLSDELVEAIQREREVQGYLLIRLAEQSKPPRHRWLVQLWRTWLRGSGPRQQVRCCDTHSDM